METTRRLIWMIGLVSVVAACNRRSRPDEECTTDADCATDAPRCIQNVCVECYDDAHCGCHEVCQDRACVPLTADRLGLSATTYAPANHGTCAGNNDCTVVGQICNPLTAACVDAASYTTSCANNTTCPAGPDGEILACEPSSKKCLPAPLCRSNNNCCGGQDTFACDTSAAVCRPIADECTPPSGPTSTCPLLPKQQGACAVGEFCSLIGECVQCTCDADCSPSGSNTGLKCYQPDHTCKPRDYCTDGSECADDEACDTVANACTPMCTEDTEATVCADDEFCSLGDQVCRPIEEMECSDDSQEPNNELEGAVALTLPTVGSTRTEDELSLCTDDEDWYALDVVEGDEITIRGVAVGDLQAQLKAFGPDGVTQLDDGSMGSFSANLLEFTANTSATHYVSVTPYLSTIGFYRLTLERSTATACIDPYEDDGGDNDLPAAASLVFDFNDTSAVPEDCSLATSGTTSTLTCDDVMRLCPGDTDYLLVHVDDGSKLAVQLTAFAGNLNIKVFGPFGDSASLSTTSLAAEASTLNATETVSVMARSASYYLLQLLRQSGSETSYDLQIAVTEPASVCPEDDFDGDDAAEGNSTPAVLVVDAAGLNDTVADATGVALPDDGTAVLIASSDGNLTLCRADDDWYRLGSDTNGELEPLPADRRVRIEILTAEDETAALSVNVGTATTTIASAIASPYELTIPLTTGSDDYFVQVAADSDNAGHVAYTLRATLVVPPTCAADGVGDLTDSNNSSPATAVELTAPWPVDVNDSYSDDANGSLSLCAHDDDWYRIAVPNAVRIVASVTYDPTQADVGLALYDDSVAATGATDGVPPVTGLLDLSEKSSDPYQRVVGAPGGDAYLLLYNRTGWPLLDYTLSVQFIADACYEDSYDTNATIGANNNVADRATPLALTQADWDEQEEWQILDPLALCAGTTGISDWYSVSLTAGDEIEASVYYDPNDGDLDLTMYAPGTDDEALAISTDNVQPTGVLSVSYTVTNDDPVGNYLLQVRPYGTPQNLYYLEVRVQRACIDDAYEPNLSAEVAALDWNSSAGAVALSLCNDSDWFAVTVPGNTTSPRFCASFVHNDGDIDLSLWSSASVNTSDLSSPSPTGSAVATSTTKGDWEQVAAAQDANATTYYLQVALDPRDQVNTSYTLEMLEGNATCP